MPAGSFELLKGEVVFHETRLKGLYESALAEDIVFWLDEKSNNRNAARHDCEMAMRKAEAEAVYPPGNKWNTSRIPAYLRLDLECRFLVGSEDYEAPEKASRDSLFKLLQHIEELQVGMNTRSGAHTLDHVKAVMQEVDWSQKDVKTLTEALTAKADLLGELSKLFNETQERAWAISRLQAKKEELFRKEDRANAEGEAAIATEILYDRMVLHEDVLRIAEEKLNMVHQSIDACMKQKQAKSSGWKLGAAALEVLKDSKVARQGICNEDLDRLRRGLEYEYEQREASRKANDHQLMLNQESFEQLNQETLDSTQRLFALAEEFKKEEKRLHEFAQGRDMLVSERLEIIATEAQLAAEFQDFVTACKRHESNLHQSITASKVASDALQVLQEYSAGNSSFFGQDFTQANEQLKVMHLHVLREMNLMHNEYVRDGETMIKRLELQQKNIETMLTDQEMWAEQMREIMNPMAKKFVDQSRKLGVERNAIIQEIDSVKQRMSATENRYFVRVKTELAELGIEVETPGEDIEWKFLMRREEMVDIRDQLLDRPMDRILDDNDHLQLAEQAIGESIDQRINKMSSLPGLIVGPTTVTQLAAQRQLPPTNAGGAAAAASPFSFNERNSQNTSLSSISQPQRRVIPRESRVVASYVTGTHVPRPMEIRNPGAPPPLQPNSSKTSTPADESLTSSKAAGSPMGRLTPLEMSRNSKRTEPRTIATLKYDPNKPLRE